MSVVKLCRALEVSESGYYKHWRSAFRPYRHEKLLALIYEAIRADEENASYGTKRLYDYLRINSGYEGSYSKVRRVCKENNLIIKMRRKPNGITKADAEAQKSENIIKQDFRAQQPNTKYLTDITEIQCADGKLYLSPILDCFDGSIVSFTMDTNKCAELCAEAFELACKRNGARGMIIHSDRGSQYTSRVFREMLKKYGAIQSMSGTGRCYDNARMESFFATLKKEKLYKMDTAKMTTDEVKSVIHRYIAYYNLRRIYSANGGYPPLVYRKMYYEALNDIDDAIQAAS